MLKRENSERLQTIAARVCWWQRAEETLSDTPLFLCRVMTFGTWEDVCFCLDHFGNDAFRDALQSAPPGLLDRRSWSYWHHRLAVFPVPSLPIRAIPE